jgi:DNA-binding XRE family transcriptional regulator
VSTYVEGVSLATEVCCNCGMVFAMPEDYQRRRRDDRKNFYCPSGHPQHYAGETEAARLKRELERARQMQDAADARAATAAQEREQIAKAHKRMRHRVMNGVCPCCNRTFQNLMQHMKTEHPAFDSKKTLATMRAAFGMTQGAVAREVGVNSVYVSMYERDKPLPKYAKQAIDGWIETHQGKMPA